MFRFHGLKFASRRSPTVRPIDRGALMPLLQPERYALFPSARVKGLPECRTLKSRNEDRHNPDISIFTFQASQFDIFLPAWYP